MQLIAENEARILAAQNLASERSTNSSSSGKPIFDAAKVQAEINAQVQITQAFTREAPKAAASFADSQAKSLRDQIKETMTPSEKTALIQEAEKWGDGGIYRVALHTAIGGLGGGLDGALGAAASASSANLMNAFQDNLQLSLQAAGLGDGAAKGVAQLVAGLTAAGIGAAVGGTQGAATAWTVDANNRQLHKNELNIIKKLASDKAVRACQSGDSQCIQSQTIFWSDTLEKVAKGLVDNQANDENLSYLNQLINASQNSDSEGARGQLSAYMQRLKEAQSMLAPYMGKTITFGDQIQYADGSPQQYFSATDAQRNDPYANYILGIQPPANVELGTALRDEARLQYMSAINGSTLPDTIVEETLFGNKLFSSIGKALGRLIAAAPIVDAAEVVASNGGNIAASKVSNQATRAAFTNSDLKLFAQIDSLPNVTLQGEVREVIVNDFFTRNGFKSLIGKCGSNCFDGVFVQGDRVYLVETKPLNANGSIKLSPGDATTGLPPQMTDAWVRDGLTRLSNSGDQAAKNTAAVIEAAIKNGSLTKLVVGVDQSGLTMVRLPTALKP